MSSQIPMSPVQKEIRSAQGWMMLLGVLLIAVNLRAGITSVGPLIGILRDDTGLSGTAVGLLTTLPLLAFAALSPLAPALARKAGLEIVMLLSMLVLTAGIAVRSIVPSAWGLMLGTILLGMAIAVGNVLLPSLIKRDYPDRIGMMTGVYSTSMSFFGALASGLSIPLAAEAGLGWQGSLGVWLFISLLAMGWWIMIFKKRARVTGAAARAAKSSMLKSSRAWFVTLYMGFQGFTFYINISWLPEILRSQGVDYTTAGWMLSLVQFVSLPFSFIIPVLAGRRENQRVLVGSSAALMLVGYLGLLSGLQSLNIVWVIFIGIAVGSNLSLSLMFFTLRTRTAHEAAALSGMAQSFGYLLAAAGPMMMGYLHDYTGGWNLSLLILAGAVVLLFVFGMGAAKPGYIHCTDQS